MLVAPIDGGRRAPRQYLTICVERMASNDERLDSPGRPAEGNISTGLDSSEEVVIAYHERTKHAFHRYAASLGYLDWASQPNPFRRYDGAHLVRLPLPAPACTLHYAQLYERAAVPAAALSLDTLSQFFRYALSLTAWKSVNDTTWPLRANPSSGNLHPTEGYALLPALEGVGQTPAVYHYAPREHGLERRASIDETVWRRVFSTLPAGSFVVGLSSIHWREAWKYGERAFRYCQHDVGHALGTLRVAAAALGWTLTLLTQASDDEVAHALGLDRDDDFAGAEREAPEFLALVAPALDTGVGSTLDCSLIEAGHWQGTANALSVEHSAEWPVIDEVASATRSAGGSFIEDADGFPPSRDLVVSPCPPRRLTIDQAIFGRRSAMAMDGMTSISVSTFYQMLARLVPTHETKSMPWDSIPWRPRVHLVLFVHRVEGLQPGLYALTRDVRRRDAFRASLKPGFLWQEVPSCPPGLPLVLLQPGDCRALAAQLSCGQNIAADGAFSLGMIADFTDSLLRYGATFYRHLFWECGLIGQVLYLEAEEAGIRATGIGCYFDDPVREVLGLTSHAWQSFYHFTVGGPVEDRRLTTLPAYGSEAQR